MSTVTISVGVYLTITLLCNTVSIIFSSTLPFQTKDGLSCRLGFWMLVNVLICSVNIIVSFHFCFRFITIFMNDDYFLRRIVKWNIFLRSDPIVIGYTWILAAFFVWLCIGADWSQSGSSISCLVAYSDDSRAMVSVSRAITIVLVCGYSFISVGLVARCCCDCCLFCSIDEEDSSTHFENEWVNGRIDNQQDLPNLPPDENGSWLSDLLWRTDPAIEMTSVSNASDDINTSTRSLDIGWDYNMESQPPRSESPVALSTHNSI